MHKIDGIKSTLGFDHTLDTIVFTVDEFLHEFLLEQVKVCVLPVDQHLVQVEHHPTQGEHHYPAQVVHHYPAQVVHHYPAAQGFFTGWREGG